MANRRQRGATFAELLITVVVLLIVAAVVLPSLSFNDSSKLTVAAEETVNALRFARNEAMRTGQSILVDTETVSGRLRLLRGGCGSPLSAGPVLDPLTRRAYDVDLTGGSLSSGVVAQAKFLVAGVTGSSLAFGPTGAVAESCTLLSGVLPGVLNAILPAGLLSDNSLVLAYAGKTVKIAIDPATGRVAGF